MRLALVLALALLAVPASTTAAPVSDAAVAAIALPEPQLRGFLARVVFSTQTMGMGVYALGIDKACTFVRPAFQAAVAKHLPAWRATLVGAYRDNIPADVLENAVAAGPVAGAAIVLPYLGKVGAQMQQRSEPLLKQAAGDVLEPVMAAASSVDTAKVDGAARGKELDAALANGTAQCGLLPTNERPS